MKSSVCQSYCTMLQTHVSDVHGMWSTLTSKCFHWIILTFIIQNMLFHLSVYLYKLQKYSRNCFLRQPLGAAKNSLKRLVVCETRVSKTSPYKENILLLKIQVEGIFRTVTSTCSCIHWYLTSLPSLLHAQSLHEKWFQAYTSLQQGTFVLYCGPILMYIYIHVNDSLCAKSGGHWSPQRS